jgi:hypothetical protein
MHTRTVGVRWRVAGARPTGADGARSQPIIAKPATHSVARLKGVVDLRALPTVKCA